jgi:hypothetical protein
MERLAPPPKDRPIDFPMPVASTARDINAALAKVAEAVGAGTLTPGGKHRGASRNSPVFETVDLEDRLSDWRRNKRKAGDEHATDSETS